MGRDLATQRTDAFRLDPEMFRQNLPVEPQQDAALADIGAPKERRP
jgi:hypothetical protein